MVFKLPRLKADLAIVDGQGKPTNFFLGLFNLDFAQRIEANEAAQEQNIQDLTELVQAVQAAQAAAQAAQEAANNGEGGTGNSASTTGTVSPNGTWQTAAIISLTGVVAGDLTIGGTGPIQTADVVKDQPGSAPGQFRVVEVVSGVDTVLFTGDYSVYASGEVSAPPLVSNLSASSVAAFSSSRTSTGAVDYRVDVRQTSGTDVFNMSVYLFARRTV